MEHNQLFSPCGLSKMVSRVHMIFVDLRFRETILTASHVLPSLRHHMGPPPRKQPTQPKRLLTRLLPRCRTMPTVGRPRPRSKPSLSTPPVLVPLQPSLRWSTPPSRHCSVAPKRSGRAQPSQPLPPPPQHTKESTVANSSLWRLEQLCPLTHHWIPSPPSTTNSTAT